MFRAARPGPARRGRSRPVHARPSAPGPSRPVRTGGPADIRSGGNPAGPFPRPPLPHPADTRHRLDTRHPLDTRRGGGRKGERDGRTAAPTRWWTSPRAGRSASRGATRRHGRVRRCSPCSRCSRCSRRRRPAPRRVHPPDRRARWPGSGSGATVIAPRRTGPRPASPDARASPRRAPTCWTTARSRTTNLSVRLGRAGADLPWSLLRGGGAIRGGGDGRATVGVAEAAGVCERERGEESAAAAAPLRPPTGPTWPEVENRTLKPNVETRKARRASVPST